MAADRPTIVFVHGAWADASGFGGVIRVLGDRGLTAIGMANPLRHLTDDAAYLADLLRTISGPIVLVGHSYGGAVMSNAATGNQQVQALVFCNGWMPARHLAAELSGSGVTVNSVWPGGVRTGMLAAYRGLRPGDADPAEPARLIANLLAGQASGEVVDIHGEQGRRLRRG